MSANQRDIPRRGRSWLESPKLQVYKPCTLWGGGSGCQQQRFHRPDVHRKPTAPNSQQMTSLTVNQDTFHSGGDIRCQFFNLSENLYSQSTGSWKRKLWAFKQCAERHLTSLECAVLMGQSTSLGGHLSPSLSFAPHTALDATLPPLRHPVQFSLLL